MREKYNLKQLETWCNLKCGDIIFDSNKHGWSWRNNEFRKNIFNKSKVCIVIENEDGEIFGCYINSKIDEVSEWIDEKIKDENAFVFNLESNGRHEGPMKFDIKKEKSKHTFFLFPDYYDCLFQCGNCNILIKKENKKSESRCEQDNFSYFDYRGVEKALVQNPNEDAYDEKYFTLKRFIVIQMI